MENLLTYSPVSYSIVSNTLTLGYAAMAAGLVYFVTTSKRAAPPYRLSSTLSAVVMVSAFLALYQLHQTWLSAFTFNGEVWEGGATAFNNGYRYINWSIDVPILLTQLLIVMGFTGARFRRLWLQFVVAGLAMIYTGYAGQFYEATDSARLYLWGAISTAFFLWILVLVRRTIFDPPDALPERAAGLMRGVWWVLLGSWLLYPGAYLMPVFALSEGGVVARQISFTVADVVSKVIYGVMLSRVAELRSQADGYAHALESETQPNPDRRGGAGVAAVQPQGGRAPRKGRVHRS
ncbi:bacteriorhodopsin [Truepera radiovictrix]|nr:bacteriorhodopsin [Truepera radiovictrix]WMT56087.1 bacteriorhodopsin [Truepera radiovictrix]